MFADKRSLFSRVFFAPPCDFDGAPLAPDDDRPDLDEADDDGLLELDDEYWDALLPDDDYEPQPEPGDFWLDHDAA